MRLLYSADDAIFYFWGNHERKLAKWQEMCVSSKNIHLEGKG